ncbi:unnamed protein product [Ilex paraguariensis]|uniref:Leucine-rich repeat-containing N-terminal plant-type domain-containing protein n=1 Tax=Ilex paraguariensis TaxID=185542 RepID=A0ABC8R927_9AQUA
MTMKSSALTVLVVMYVWLLSSGSFSYGAKSDIDCLRAMKDSLEDPFNYLNTWDFNNSTEGFICRFTGIDCWQTDENRVLTIRLSDMGLKGEFPRGIANCTALTGLDMSSNKLYGHIPSKISQILEFVTSLDLSSNNFSGHISLELANCSSLNVLKLDNNQLTGHIPSQIGLLARIKTFSVANNHLTGPVPKFSNATISADSYAGNAGLCGGPLPPCKGQSKQRFIGIVAGAAVGGATVSTLVVECPKEEEDDDPDRNTGDSDHLEELIVVLVE